MSSLEGLLNAYLGMSIGEHLGSLFVSFWILYASLAMRTYSIFDPRLSCHGLLCAALMLPAAFEPLSPRFAAFAMLSIPVYGLFVLWLLLLAYTFIRYKNEKVLLTWPVWLTGFNFLADQHCAGFHGIKKGVKNASQSPTSPMHVSCNRYAW